MKQIRIHNDIHFSWTIDRGDGTPYNLEGRDLRLWMKSGNLEYEFKNFTLENNTLHWTFQGKDQYKTGLYSVVLAENAGRVGEVTLDEREIVELVSESAYANGEADDGTTAEYVEVVSHLKTQIYQGVAEEVYDQYVVPLITPFLEMQVLISNVEFAALEEAGEVDPNKIYYIYEAEEE